MATAKRLQPFGTTIFAEMTDLAYRHDAIDLGQGYPNFDGPDFVKAAAMEAIKAGRNQYARMAGEPELNTAIAARFSADTGIHVDPEAEVTVTSGCTEALASAFLGILEPGDEVIIIEPYYDAYPVDTALADAVPRYVTLRPPEFRLPEDELRAAFGDRTRAIVVNTPHNPTGRVFDRSELELIAELCQRHDAIAITDEVYERMAYEGEHLALAAFDGMWERTATLSSLGKSFSLTGWKIGWAIAPPALSNAIRAAHQFLTFALPTPLQLGAAAALRAPQSYYDDLLASYRAKRDLLCEGLNDAGFEVYMPEGTYFMLADHTQFGFADDVTFARHLVEHVGVASIPPSAFYNDPEDGADLIRFSFCKTTETLTEAIARLQRLVSG